MDVCEEQWTLVFYVLWIWTLIACIIIVNLYITFLILFRPCIKLLQIMTLGSICMNYSRYVA